MKKFTVFTLIACIMLTGCQIKESSSSSTSNPAVVEKEGEYSTEPHPLPGQQDEEQNVVIDPFFMLELGMGEEDVRQLLGRDFTLVKNMMDGNEAWRYDIEASEGYRFADEGFDIVDIEGLKTGAVQKIIFIDWTDEGLLQSATMYERGLDSNGYVEYRLRESGVVEKNLLNF